MGKYIVLSLFLLLGYLGRIHSQEECPSVNPKSNFQMRRYLGTWYETRRYPNPFERNGICVREIVRGLDKSSRARIQQIMQIPGTNGIVTTSGTLRPASSLDNGLLRLKYDGRPEEYDYIVLGTDYRMFAIVWSCRVTGGRKSEFAWVLTRTKTVSPQNRRIIDDFIRRNTPIDLNRLRETPQNCRAP